MSPATPVGTAPDRIPPGLIPIGVRPSLGEYLREIWDRRDFAITVSLGDLRARNQNTVLGNLWHLLNPLFLAGVFYLIFGVVLGAREGVRTGAYGNYAAFLIIGIFTFVFTSKSLLGGARTIVSNLGLIQAVTFPRALLPIASTLTETAAHASALVAMAGIVVLTGVAPNPAWMLLVPALLIQAVFNLGLTLTTSRLTFHFRDVEQVLPYLIRMGMYLSGVFFAEDLVLRKGGEAALTVFTLNPMYAYMKIMRDAVMLGTADPGTWLMAGWWAAVALASGFLFFRHRESEYSLG